MSRFLRTQTNGPPYSLATPAIGDVTGLEDALDAAGAAGPDSVSFTAQTGVTMSTVTVSNTVTLAGTSTEVWPLVVRGSGTPQLQLNGGSWTTEAIARTGDTITLRLTSSAAALTALSCTLYAPNQSASFSVTTTSSTLLTGLVASWGMEEVSGNRADSHGSHTLTDNNTVTQAAGRVNNAASFASATSEYLSVSSVDFQPGNFDFTYCFWLYFTTKPGGGSYADVLNKDNGGGSREFIVEYDGGADRLIFYCRKGDNSGWVTATWGSALTTGTWYFVEISHDAANDKVCININNGTEVQTAWSGGVYAGTAALAVGGTTFGSWFLNGRIDELNYWTRRLTSGERASLYNSGSGLAYPF